jgi:transposase
MAKMIPNKDMLAYLKGDDSSTRKQYLAMVRFYLDGWDAHQVAETFGYTVNTVYTPQNRREGVEGVMRIRPKLKIDFNRDDDPY